MLAEDLLSNSVFPLKKTDRVEAVKIFFDDWGINELPVVDDKAVLGFVKAEMLYDKDDDESIEHVIKPFETDLPKIDAHLFEIVKKLIENDWSSVPVLTNTNEFAGIVTAKQINDAYRHSPLVQPGAIITLQMNARDYSLSELSRIIEYNDCKIVHLFLYSSNQETQNLWVSLKLNTTDVRNVLSALERHNYKIKSVHQSATIETDMNDRFDWLIKFINT